MNTPSIEKINIKIINTRNILFYENIIFILWFIGDQKTFIYFNIRVILKFSIIISCQYSIIPITNPHIFINYVGIFKNTVIDSVTNIVIYSYMYFNQH